MSSRGARSTSRICPVRAGRYAVPAGKFTQGAEGAIAVRPHVVRLWAEEPDNMENVLAGTVMRQVFLGASRDYLVEAPDGTQIRVVASAAEHIAPGSPVWLYLPPDRCRVVAKSE